jgi:hypothetical protein
MWYSKWANLAHFQPIFLILVLVDIAITVIVVVVVVIFGIVGVDLISLFK